MGFSSDIVCFFIQLVFVVFVLKAADIFNTNGHLVVSIDNWYGHLVVSIDNWYSRLVTYVFQGIVLLMISNI